MCFWEQGLGEATHYPRMWSSGKDFWMRLAREGPEMHNSHTQPPKGPPKDPPQTPVTSGPPSRTSYDVERQVHKFTLR